MAMVTENPRETGEWDRAKRKVMKRDQYRCQSCGMNESEWQGADLQVHHIKAVEDGGGNDLSNLVLLCSYCHSTVHSEGPVGGSYPVSIIPEREILHISTRGSYELTEKDKEFISVLRQNGPTQKKGIISKTSIGKWEFQTCAENLMLAKYVGRVKRGVYGYITKEEHDRVEKEIAEGKDPEDVRYEAYNPEENNAQ